MENLRLSRFSNIVDIFRILGGNFGAILKFNFRLFFSVLKVRHWWKHFTCPNNEMQNWSVVACLVFFTYICISVLGRNDMKMKREYFFRFDFSFIKAAFLLLFNFSRKMTEQKIFLWVRITLLFHFINKIHDILT